MSNNHTSIHDFDFTLICNYFKSLERQGPGSPEATQKALSFINELSEKSQIADIGCGTGGQTITLAEYTKGQITGIDLFPDFIEIFNKNAAKALCSDRVKGITGSMDHLPFQNEELDLSYLQHRIRTWHERMEQISEKERFHRSHGSILVHSGTSCRNRRFLDGCLSRNQYDSRKNSSDGKSRIHPDRPFHSTGEVLDGTLLCPTSFASRGIFEGTPRE